MEIKKEDFELFMQFKKFMSEMGDSPTSSHNSSKPRRERGTGSIITLSGKRKRKYLASITTGYDVFTGKQTQTPLGYFVEYEHANKALDIYLLEKSSKCAKGTCLEYIYSVDGKPSKKTTLIDSNVKVDTFNQIVEVNVCPTFKEIWDIIFFEEIGNLSENTIINYRTAFNNLEDIHKLRIDEINLHNLQPIFNKQMELGSGLSKLNNIKIVASKIFKYAIKYDYVEKDYSKFVTLRNTSDKKVVRTVFTNEEIQMLISDNSYESKIVLIYLYTGMRPRELCNLKREDIHLNEKYIIGGVKTSNGIDRVIPLHDFILPYVKDILETSAKNNTKFILFDVNNRPGTDKYRKKIFKPLMERLGLNHDPYDTRHTFATLCDEYGLNEFLVKKIIGHSAKDLTKDVYTHVSTERLIEEINKIPTLK